MRVSLMYGGIQSGPRRQLNIEHHAYKHSVATVIAAAAIAFFLIVPRVAATEVSYVRIPWEEVHVQKPKVSGISADLTAAQTKWINKLEYCESRDDASAINEKDRDGTPSYYAFQFKPSTFRAYGVAYKVIPKELTGTQLMEDLKSTDLQRQIVEHMLFDRTVNWHLQFPVCVQLLGMPPGAVQ